MNVKKRKCYNNYMENTLVENLNRTIETLESSDSNMIVSKKIMFYSRLFRNLNIPQNG